MSEMNSHDAYLKAIPPQSKEHTRLRQEPSGLWLWMAPAAHLVCDTCGSFRSKRDGKYSEGGLCDRPTNGAFCRGKLVRDWYMVESREEIFGIFAKASAWVAAGSDPTSAAGAAAHRSLFTEEGAKLRRPDFMDDGEAKS